MFQKPKRSLILVAGLGMGAIAVVLNYVLQPQKSCACKAPEGRGIVGAMNRSQQAHYLENKQFANTLEQLNLGIEAQTKRYTFLTIATNTAVFNYGISNTRDRRSYVGAVFASQKFNTSEAILCEATTNDLQKISRPIDAKTCGAGTTKF